MTMPEMMNCPHQSEGWCLKCVHAELARLREENERLAVRDGNAAIALSFEKDGHPFCREECKILDFGVADNVYLVESAELAQVAAERDAYKAFRDDIDALRAEEGASILIGCDNPDYHAEEGCHIDVEGSWTNWETVRFKGKNLDEALHAAREKDNAP